MTDKIYTIDEIKAIVKPIAEKYKADRIWLFGSYAKGQATERSDIDLIIGNIQRICSLPEASMYGDLIETLNKHIDFLTENGIKQSLNPLDPVYINIEKEKILIYGQ